MNTHKLCECCNTNKRKAGNAKYCQACSDHICNMILQRANRIDARYKKVFRSLHENIVKLSVEEPFLSKNLKDMLDTEQLS